MLSEFALLIEGSVFDWLFKSSADMHLYVSFRKRIAPQKWRMNGKNI